MCDITSGATFIALFQLRGGCFSPDTLISINSEEKKRISDLKMGMEILTMNMKTMELVKDEISCVYPTQVEAESLIEMADGSVIRTTPNHPLLTAEGEWKKVESRKSE